MCLMKVWDCHVWLCLRVFNALFDVFQTLCGRLLGGFMCVYNKNIKQSYHIRDVCATCGCICMCVNVFVNVFELCAVKIQYLLCVLNGVKQQKNQ